MGDPVPGGRKRSGISAIRNPHSRSSCILCCLLLSASPLHAAVRVLPDELTLDVGDIDEDGEAETIVLRKRSVRSERYLFGTWSEADGFRKMEPFPVSTYRGYVKGDRAMRVNASIEPGGLLNANFSEGSAIVATVTERKIGVGAGKGTRVMSAGNKVIPLKATRVSPTPGGYLVPPQPMRRVQFAVEISKGYVEEVGGDMETAVSQVEQRFNDGDFVYARDLGVAWEVAAIVIRQDAGGGVRWKELVDVEAGRRFSLLGFFQGNTGRPRAWGGPVFRSDDPASCAPFSVARVNVRHASGLVHEVGHKFRACHNVDDGDAMRGARSLLGSANLQLMLNHCEGRPEGIFPAVSYSAPLPPFAMDDFVNTTRDTPVTVDVLDNDYDGNGDAVSLQGAGPKSEKGGRVALSEDRKKVVYAPPPGFVGQDRFTYAIVDSTGVANRTGKVKADVRVEGLACHLPLDELRDGRHPAVGPYETLGRGYALKTAFYKGVRGNALFNANLQTRGYVLFPDAGDPGRESLSVSLWVLYPDSKGLEKPGVIVCKGACFGGEVGGWVLRGWGIGHRGGGRGFIFAGNVARQSQKERFDLRSEEPIRPNAWYHLAVVLDRGARKMRAWVNNEEVLGSDTRPDIPDGVIECYMPLALFNGFNWKGGRSCSALIDEVRIYTSALAPEQVADLYAEGRDAPVPDLKTGTAPRPDK
ncbi:MAG: LamG-like jellyroll fold domain-containing protein [Planctomycetota bacterium]